MHPALNKQPVGPLVAHDYFAIRGGGERLVLELAGALEADLMLGYRTDESYAAEMFPDKLIDLQLPPPLRRPGLRLLSLSAAFAMRRREAVRHATRIFSGSAAPFAAPNRSLPGKNIFYCHTPPRFIYDQAGFFADGYSPVQRLGAATLGRLYRRGYERAVAHM